MKTFLEGNTNHLSWLFDTHLLIFHDLLSYVSSQFNPTNYTNDVHFDLKALVFLQRIFSDGPPSWMNPELLHPAKLLYLFLFLNPFQLLRHVWFRTSTFTFTHTL